MSARIRLPQSVSSPLLMAAIGQLELLRLLFDEVVIPEAVNRELTQKNPDFLPSLSPAKAMREALLSQFCE